jgi:hypothetical protein
MINPSSLSGTVDAINAAVLDRQVLPVRRRREVANWIAARQGLPGAYAETFAGFPHERAKGIAVFTGERIGSASARHILGEEACRVLRLLEVRERAVTQALERASAGLMRCLERAALDARNTNPGVYCCGKCSVGVWRHLLAGGLDRQDERLQGGLKHLRSMRDGDGGWRRFPFWYTVLALSDIDTSEAAKELRYAAPQLERVAEGRPGSTTYAMRRHALASRVLNRL